MKLFFPSIFILQRKYKTIIQSPRVQQNPLHGHHSSMVEEITMYRKTLIPKSHQCRASMRQCCTSKCLSSSLSAGTTYHCTNIHTHTATNLHDQDTVLRSRCTTRVLFLVICEHTGAYFRVGLSKCVTLSRLNVQPLSQYTK